MASTLEYTQLSTQFNLASVDVRTPIVGGWTGATRISDVSYWVEASFLPDAPIGVNNRDQSR